MTGVAGAYRPGTGLSTSSLAMAVAPAAHVRLTALNGASVSLRHGPALASIDPHAMLENTFGMKVSVAMLQTCGIDQGRWRYREIYMHLKLLIVDESFITLGSANLNQRSMALDSEINIATDDPRHARDLRKRVFNQLSGGLIDGGSGTTKDVVEAYGNWIKLMKLNRRKKLAKSGSPEDRKLGGFIVPPEDNRSSTMRFG